MSDVEHLLLWITEYVSYDMEKYEKYLSFIGSQYDLSAGLIVTSWCLRNIFLFQPDKDVYTSAILTWRQWVRFNNIEYVTPTLPYHDLRGQNKQ